MRHSTLYASILFLVLLANWASAQISTEYQPMAVEGAHWICFKAYDRPWGDEYYSLSIRGDTMMNGQVYKKMYRDNLFIDHVNQRLSNPPIVIDVLLIALIRDDLVKRKVYGVIFPIANQFSTCSGEEETILFDFNAGPGDTLQSCSALPKIATPLIVDSVSLNKYECFFAYNVNNNNNLFRTLNIKGYWESRLEQNNMKIMEGIGYKGYGPFYERWGGNGGIILDWQRVGGLLCYCVGTNADCNIITSAKEINYLPIRVFPNPVEDRLYFESNHTAFKWLRIYHSSGLLINELLPVPASIDTHLLQPGHYYLQGLGEGGEIYLGKFIKL